MKPIRYSSIRLVSAIAATVLAGNLHAAVTITVANNVPNGNASGGGGSGLGSLTTSSGSIASDRGLPVTTYTVNNVNLTSVGGGASESFTFTITYSQIGGTGVQFNPFGNVSVTGGTDAQIDGAEQLTATIALASSSFGDLSLIGYTMVKVGGLAVGESATVNHGGTPLTVTSATQDYAISGTSMTLIPDAGTDFNLQGFTAQFTAVPEPSVALLGGLGLLALLRRRR